MRNKVHKVFKVHKVMKLLLPFYFMTFITFNLFGQASIVFQNGYMVEHGGTIAQPVYVVVNNSSPTAIKPGVGWFVSENEFNILQWNIGSATGTYVVPFGYSTAKYLPLTLDITTAGIGSGVVRFSTYHCAALNTPNPSDVTNHNAFILPGSPSNADDSYNMTDRYYIVDANTGYTTKPTPGNITFSYISGTANSEVASPNTLVESRLMAQRFNSTTNTWSDWFGEGCTDAIINNVGTVQTGTISPANFFRSFCLWDNLTPLPLTTTSTNILCGGTNTGSATVMVYGGVNPYTYSWTGGNTNANATGLSAGSYTVTVKDNNGCTSTASIIITAPPVLTATPTVTANATACASTGAASVTPGGGVSPYTFLWTSGSTTDNATGLSAGSYTITVSDNNGCAATASITITAPPVLTATANVLANASACASIGSADVTPTGGTLPYTYLWTGGNTNSNITGLSAGTYTISVEDNNGCSYTSSITITAPPAVAVIVSASSIVACSGTQDTLIANMSGGNIPYTYSWNTGSSSSNDIIMLDSTATYTVVVMDSNGCPTRGNVTIQVIPAPDAIVGPNRTICLGDSTTIGGNVASGVSYLWKPAKGLNSNTISQPVASPTVTTTYTLLVKNSGGTCSNVDSVEVTVNPVPIVNTGPDELACGTGVSIGSPAVAGDLYSWLPSSGLSSDNISQPVANPNITTTYTLIETDSATGCSAEGTVVVTSVDELFYNGFSPNNDGINDWWDIPMLDCYPENTVTIINRYGSEVWKGTNYDNNTVKWEGKNMSGEDLPDGTYYYVINYSNTQKTGWVFIKR